MEFSNLIFIFRFLPIFLLVYYLVPVRWKNPVLFFGSVICYGLGNWQDTLLLTVSFLLNYLLTMVMDKKDASPAWRRVWLILLVVYDVGVLCFFKYFWSRLPLGISFYTFTMLSYVLDVYRKKQCSTRNFWELGTYVWMFPKLISGPIASFGETIGSIRERKIRPKSVEYGLSLMIVGLGFKVIIADHLATLWRDVQTVGFESISTPLAWIGMAGYCAQLFFDFQGYSLMAVGLGEMLGFTLPQNFNHPYRSKSVGEFYRRWHMTLGAWFKNYIYIPLGGNRKGKARTLFNLLIVWLVTGIWHGVTLNFLLWGLVLFLFIALEKIVPQGKLKKLNWMGHLYIWIVIPLTWMLFAITDIKQIGIYFSRLFPFFGTGVAVHAGDYITYLKNYSLFFGLAFLVSLPIVDKFWKKHWNKFYTKILLFAVFWVCIVLIAKGLKNPFMYFSF
ncbi:MAG: MBOAT family O-acyltransferase [Roseburia sp.]